MATEITLPKWYDLHVHLRQHDLLAPLIAQELKMGCAGVLAMPNTQPPVGKVFNSDPGEDQSIQDYLAMIKNAGGSAFEDIIVPLYLSPTTTPQMIENGTKNGLLRACKYYPPHATTNSDDSADISYFIKNGVVQAIQDNGIVLCLHGEMHNLSGEDFFGRKTNAEEYFYRSIAPELLEKFPTLRIVVEHVTSKVAVDFVSSAGPNVVASVTPQHLLYNIGDLLQGLKYHLYCMPLVKYEDDVEALRKAVIDSDNTKFFAGTDSAPHTVKITPCCGAAGCYTGGIAPQLYAEAFEMGGANLDTSEGQMAFKQFLCINGPTFYGLKVPSQTFTLSRIPQEIGLIETPTGTITPLPIGMQPKPAQKTTIPWSINS